MPHGTASSISARSGARWCARSGGSSGPAIAVAALTFVGVNLITPRYKSEARILIEGRENVFLRPEAEKGAIERDRTVDQEAVTSQVQLALSRDLARQVIKRAQARRAAGIRLRAARRVADPLFARLPRARQGSAEHDAGGAGARSLLRAADRVPGRQVARDRDRIPVGRSGASPRKVANRSRTAISRCSSGAAGPDPRRRQVALRRDRQAAQARWPRPRPRSRSSAPRPTCSSAPTTRRCRTRSSASRTAISRPRARRRPSRGEGALHPRHAASAAARSNPPTSSIPS